MPQLLSTRSPIAKERVKLFCSLAGRARVHRLPRRRTLLELTGIQHPDTFPGVLLELKAGWKRYSKDVGAVEQARECQQARSPGRNWTYSRQSAVPCRLEFPRRQSADDNEAHFLFLFRFFFFFCLFPELAGVSLEAFLSLSMSFEDGSRVLSERTGQAGDG